MEENTDGPEEGFYEECASGRDFILVKLLLCDLLLQCCGIRSVLGFSLFSRTLFPPNTGVKVPNLDMSCSNDPTYLVLKSKASCPPNLESALIL